MKPRLLDLFCGAGGAAMGYARAGFEVVGVDINPQPHYPFEFHQGNALNLWWARRTPAWIGFDAIHASPPCQWGTAYRRRPNHVKDSLNLVAKTRALLKATGLPYIIEQPYPNRHALEWPVVCLEGSMFGLDVFRKRMFETNWPVGLVPPTRRDLQTPRFASATNRTNKRRTVEVGVWRIPLDVQKQAMGVEWKITLEELSQAIPPAYTEFIGRQLIDQL